MKLSEITVEDLRADHNAFVKKMVEVSKKHQPYESHELFGIIPVSELAQIEHDPNWRQKLVARSPFDD